MAENQAKSMRESVSSVFSSTAMKVAGAVGVLGLGEFAKSSIELASNLNEAKNVTDTVFGDMSSQIEDFSQAAQQSFGVSQLQALKFSGSLGSIFKSSGIASDQAVKMSETLTGLAGDFASFSNIPVEEAMEKLQAGITGQVKPLEQFGILVNDNTVKLYAMQNGFKGNWESASAGEKELYRYQVILQQMSHYQGDYLKTSQSFANQWRQFQTNIQNFGANIATYALPSMADLTNSVNEFLTSINIKDVMENKVIPVFQEMGKIFDTLKNNMKTIMPIISGVVGGLVGFMVIGKVTTEVKNFMKVINGITKLTNPFYLIAAGIGLLIAGFINAYNTSDTFRQKVDNLVDKIMGFGDYAGGKLPSLLDNLTNVFQNDLQPSLDKISDISVSIFNFVSDNWSSIKNTAEIITVAILGWKTALIAVNTWTKIVAITTALFKGISTIFYVCTEATSAWEAAMILLDLAMDANPIGVVAGACALLAVGIYEVVKHWQDFIDWCYKVWDVINSNPILMFISMALNPLGTALLAVITHWNEITDAIKGAWDWLTSWIDKWNGTTLADKTVNITGNASNIDTADADQPTFNSSYGDVGGNATGTQFWKGGKSKVNEYDDEILQLPSGSKVFTAKQSKEMLNGNKGGIYVPIIIQGNVIGNDDFKDEVGQHVYNQVYYALMNS